MQLTVVQILPALDSGGVERGTLEVGAHLSANGCRSIVISAGGRMVHQLQKEGSEHIAWPIGKKSLLTLKLVRQLRQFLEKEKVDIVHVRSRFPAWIAYLAWKEMDSKTRPAFVTTVHGPYSVSAYSQVMTKGERVIVISEMIREYVVSQYHTKPEKLRLIYRGVDDKHFPFGYQPKQSWLKDWYQTFPQTKDKKLLVLPARVTKWKGQEDFIHLVAQLKKHKANVHALIVGETKKGKTNFLKKLQKKAQSLGVCENVTFVGHRDDLREIMAISSIVYSLSLEPEAFGRTTIEALSLGVPVIGYAHGGVQEQLATLLPEGQIDVGNVAEAATLTLRWLDQPPDVAKNQAFSLDTMLQKTMDVYQELAQAGQRGAD
ncbi:MAG: glycosyltransferase family 4 protein [Methylophilaceae bacterium]|nr:MAG: glycosyltransferase family 4 protein [Methylophilaceae bacterium]